MNPIVTQSLHQTQTSRPRLYTCNENLIRRKQDEEDEKE